MKQEFFPYGFRTRDYAATPRLSPTPHAAGEGEACTLSDEWEIVLPVTDSRLAKYYSHDLFRFLAEGFGLCLRVRFCERVGEELASPDRKILLLSASDAPALAPSAAEAGAFSLTVTASSVLIVGRSERGTAQGVYHLEDEMRLRGAAALTLGSDEHAPLFSPRMTHSGFELDTFSDELLAAVAHAGMDAIIVYAGHPDSTLHGFPDPDALWPGMGRGYCDFNQLVWRAEGYGLDVYIYSHIKCDMYPEGEEAAAYYEASFGTLFKNCPRLKGLILVGETFEFPSKDPHTSGIRKQLKPKEETRVSPGWYPCYDYPLLLDMVKTTVRRYNPSADIVFWSYNWGWAKKEARLDLIRALPRDVSLLVTFEMWENLRDPRGEAYRIADYSISFPGPAQVFVDEAEVARECGLRLYAMGNTGGRTWDVGAAPYLPVPQQWQKRYEALRLAKERYGLCGLMENHHYGYMPSFLDLFAKNAFTSHGMTDTAMLEAIAKRDWGASWQAALAAWREFSDGIAEVIASSLDQYGPYRCGPAYPLLLTQTQEELDFPTVPWAIHPGFAIWRPSYADAVLPNIENSLMRLRHVEEVRDHFARGVALLTDAMQDGVCHASRECAEQLAVADYIYCCYVTAAHVMRWNIAKRLLLATDEEREREGVDRLLSALSLKCYNKKALVAYMRTVAEAETENVARALASQRTDSRLGFEASMEYIFDPRVAEWKNRVTEESLALLAEYDAE